MQDKEKIAVFIDADNAPAKYVEQVLSELARYGMVNIRKAYGNWTNPSIKPWSDILHEYAIQPMQQFDLTKGKNASDIALVIDVMDVLYTKQVDIICLVSSDCDFTPLVTRILAEGKQVIGFGERKAPEAFANSCSRFLYFETESDAVKKETPSNLGQKLKCDTKLMNLLRQAVAAAENEEGWSDLGPVGQHISNQTSFDSRNHGFKKLSDLFKAIDLFEVKRVGKRIHIRDKRKQKQTV